MTYSLQRRLRLLLLVGAAVLVIIIVTSALAIRGLSRSQDELIDHVQVARVAAIDLEAALLNQETAVRGFALSGEDSILEPRAAGVAAQRRAVDKIRTAVPGDRNVQTLIDTVQKRAEVWSRQTADVAVTQVRAGDAAAATATLASSQSDFDSTRASSRELTGILTQRKNVLVAETRSAMGLLVGVSGASAVLLAVLAFIISVSLRRLVIIPLDALGEDARLVAAGDLAHRIELAGPEEIQDLAAAVEDMRRRITDELAAVADANAQVAELADGLRRSNRDLEQFAYVASHDLQEPLRKVAGFCQLLQRRYADQLDERANEYIYYAVDGAQRMQELISDLLGFSRVGRTTERFEPVELGPLVAAVWRDLPDDDAQLNVGELPTVFGDPALVRTLFVNLLGNSKKFRTDEPPTVTISADRIGDEWLIAVQDNGIGIDPQFEDRIFDIFQRLHTREVFDGTGIGLALCKRIVEFHGGSIRLAPSNAGARFLIQLPVKATLDMAGASADQPKTLR
ncbi:MAG: ATP-binding protein [Aquihabitans sp.]